MIKTLLKTLLLLAAIGYLVFALLKISRPAKDMVCTGVEFVFTDSDEVRLIDESMMTKMLAKKKISPKGTILADIDIQAIEQILSESPYIDTATCYHTASGKLCVRVTPLHPVLHVYPQEGSEFYMDPHGNVMPAGERYADLPIITGHVTRQTATKLLVLGQILNEDPYWSKQAQQIYIDERGHVEIIPRISGQRIKLGEPKDLTDKLHRVRLFYEKGMPKAGWNKYNTVDATYKNQIICTKEKQ